MTPESKKVRAAIVTENRETAAQVFARGRRERLEELCDLHPEVLKPSELEEWATVLPSLDVVFTTWGMPAPSPDFMAAATELKAVFHAAGSVKGFARPFLEHGILVTSSAAANARSVAEFTLAHILLANKGYFPSIRMATDREGAIAARQDRQNLDAGNVDSTVALLGAGYIGRDVIRLLAPLELKTICWDPFLSAEAAADLGTEKVDRLEEAFERGHVVSNHLANVPETVGLLTGDLFRRMQDRATFINTGRGHTVDEPGLVAALRDRPDLMAILDVTHPEPPAEDSPLYALPNVEISAHLAGVRHRELVRIADYAIDEYERWSSGQAVHSAVTLEQWHKLA